MGATVRDIRVLEDQVTGQGLAFTMWSVSGRLVAKTKAHATQFYASVYLLLRFNSHCLRFLPKVDAEQRKNMPASLQRVQADLKQVKTDNASLNAQLSG